jgi:hypothetical protein
VTKPLSILFLLLGVFILFGFARAAETIETDSVSISLPRNWRANPLSAPPSAVGPNDELLQFSFKVVTGVQDKAGVTQALDEVERNVATAIAKSADDPELITVSPLERRRLPNGTYVQEHLSRTKDGMQTFAQFSFRGPRSLVFVTYEAPSSEKALQVVRKALEQMKWK